MNIVLLYPDLPPDAAEDELDVLDEVNAVSSVLHEMEHQLFPLPVSLDLRQLSASLRDMKPDLVFNLVESLDGSGRFIHFAPAVLDHLHLPYTGCSADAQFITTSKLLSKARLSAEQLPTPDWMKIDTQAPADLPFPPPYIIKPVWEDASVGISDSSIVSEAKDLEQRLKEQVRGFGECFVEQYVDGREFNMSLLAGSDGPEVLPAAEIRFLDYPIGKPTIVGYDAKWDSASFEFRNTVRSFDFPASDQQLLGQLDALALRCWDLFELGGYARVDFRVDTSGRPWILEVNANPCISPDSGFVAAAARAGYTYADIIRRIINHPVHHP
jgi:D-alanine-D-alanine ligase